MNDDNQKVIEYLEELINKSKSGSIEFVNIGYRPDIRPIVDGGYVVDYFNTKHVTVIIEYFEKE